ncbi:MAG: R3H domain-containing nucleic acid-binding protein [Verrucomicrobiales bacterium]|nr:R3H domain-containing nucleic acid-binding protein [Verrucomicrobiales bacterium]
MDSEAGNAEGSGAAEVAKEVLDTMLGYLGFVAEVEAEAGASGPGLQVYTGESEMLIGRDGDRLDDIQYLLNRVLQKKMPDAPRVRVDVEHFRTMQEDRMLEAVRAQAERVRTTGEPVKLEPMNGYFRRLVHNAFADDPEIESVSPGDRGRVKRITLRRRRLSEGGDGG